MMLNNILSAPQTLTIGTCEKDANVMRGDVHLLT